MNKILLQKGLRSMSFSIVFCFIGPFVIHQAFQNKNHPLFYPVFVLGILLLTLTLYFGFKGIKTLVNAMLGERKKKQS